GFLARRLRVERAGEAARGLGLRVLVEERTHLGAERGFFRRVVEVHVLLPRLVLAPLVRPGPGSPPSCRRSSRARTERVRVRGSLPPHCAPYTGPGGGALAMTSCTASPTSRGSYLRPMSFAGPCCQPSATLMWPPHTSNTRPVTSQSSLPSQTTSGDTLDGSFSSQPSGLSPE